MDISYKIIEKEQALLSVKDEWNILYQAGDYDFFQSFSWVYTWWKHYKHNSELFCVLFYDKEQLIFIAPMVICNDNDKKMLRFTGGNLSDYNYLLFKNGCKPEMVLKYFYTLLKRFLGVRFDEVQFKHINLLKQNMFNLNIDSFGLKLQTLENEPAVTVKLPESLNEYYDKIGSKRTKTFSRYERVAFEREGFCFDFIKKNEDLPKYFSWFKEHKKRLWGQYNMHDKLPPELHQECFFDFLNDIAQDNIESNSLLIPTISNQDTIIASGLYFQHQKTISAYMHCWDYTYKNLSIGTVVDWMMIKHSILNGFKFFDIGRGDEHYKFRFGGESVLLDNFAINSLSMAMCPL